MASETLGRSFAKTLLLSVAIGFAVGVMFAIPDGIEPGELAIFTAVSTLYSASIGVPAMLLFRTIGPRLRGVSQLRQWLIYAGSLLVLTAGGTLFARVVLAALGLTSYDAMWDGYLTGLQIALAISVPCTLGAMTFARLHSRLASSERLATEARLASLESRVRPHFLFNALNSAIALIPEDPARAEDMLERLSGLLRFSLDAQARQVPLGEELRVVVDYLEIERARFGARLAYEIDVPDPLRAHSVPAFAIQTLVENSVKYAVSPRKQGATIAIRARRDGERIAIEVADDGPGFAGPVWVPGHGLDGLRARLDAMYGREAGLTFGTGPGGPERGGARVTIELPVTT
ncbi:MAG: histidine kinase [Kofleriaceae bacterium]